LPQKKNPHILDKDLGWGNWIQLLI